MTADSLMVGLQFAAELQGSGIRLGFNSLHAGASVNHLHFQFWWNVRALPIELEAVETVVASDRLLVQRDKGYLSRFILFTFDKATPGHVVEAVMPALQHLVRLGVPYNLILVSGRLFLLPRRAVQEHLGSINVGFPEVAGSAFVPSRSDFEALGAEDVLQYWQKHVRVDDATFEGVVDIVKQASL